MSAFDHKAFLKNLTTRPGVYRMYDAAGDVIYVGKAKNLKNRVSSYFRNSSLAVKTQALVTQIANIEVTVTHTEAEALLLECNLIKQIRPRYNVLLKDDKSYPMIRISRADYPRISFYRGNRNRKDAEYFGPYPSSSSVKETMNLLQKLFKVRQCEDSYFANRSRPCLQYQIKRCSAPCVEYVSPKEYSQDLQNTRLFLQGKSQDVVGNLVQRMDEAAQALNYEAAAVLRDQIRDVQKVAERQYVASGQGDVDVLAMQIEAASCCVHVHFIRSGQSLGGKSFFPRMPKGADPEEVLSAFVAQYYLRQTPPGEIVLDRKLSDADVLAEALSMQADKKIRLIQQARGDKAKWLRLAQTNTRHAMEAKIASKEGVGRRLDALKELLLLDELPQRMECFDISHTQGELTVASCVVFDGSGARKDQYRKFNIKGITPGDDYAAMRQALHRRYSRLKKEEARLPDILFIDGGKGQVSEAEAVLEELELRDITIVGVAKGPARKAGEETLVLPQLGLEFNTQSHNPGLHLIQQIRDEAHRFAITGHRARRAKARKQSVLEEIPGIGAKRRQQLLKHFGGIQGIMSAGTDDLARVPGISRSMAETLYEHINSKN